MNYGNRNASSPYTAADLGRGYLGAVAVSASITMYSRILFAGLLSQLGGAKLVLINAFLSYIATALAGASNLILMRYKEMKTGIEVFNEDGTVSYGKSQAAGRKAIFESALSRFILPLPCLFLPAICNFILETFGLWPKTAIVGKILEAAIIMFSLTFALPMSIALFKQKAVIKRKDIDEHLKLEAEEFYFNKGL